LRANQIQGGCKEASRKKAFEHYVIPRFTSFRMPFEAERKEISIQELYSEIVVDEFRNQLIVDDVINAFKMAEIPLSSLKELPMSQSLPKS